MDEPRTIATLSELSDRVPTGVKVDGVELVVIRVDSDVSVFAGRCLHRGALLADGKVVGDDLICSLHGWDYRVCSGVSAYNPAERLHRYETEIVDDEVRICMAELRHQATVRPTSDVTETPVGIPDTRAKAVSEYEWHYENPHGGPEEDRTGDIHELALHGLDRVGHHGPVAAMGVPRQQLPSWDGLQFLTAQLSRLPLLDSDEVDTSVVIGPGAERPLQLELPLFVSDMSFGALSEEAKVALGRGSELAGTAICSGEGGMLPEEQAENSRYMYELGTAGFGWDWSLLEDVQAFHLKFGQGAKTGTGGHLPGSKVTARIAEVRGIPTGTASVSPSRHERFGSLADASDFVSEVRSRSGGIPVGAKLSAQHIEADLDAALEIGVDYVILDGRGGGTGAAPLIFRDHISVPTIPAIARARRHLDRVGAHDVTLVATGGLRTAADFAKALALGADAVAIANSALQAIGCVGMRACHTDRCPVGIATQDPELRARLPVQAASERLARFLGASVELMCVLARACGHDRLSDFSPDDLSTYDRELHHLTGVAYAGVLP